MLGQWVPMLTSSEWKKKNRYDSSSRLNCNFFQYFPADECLAGFTFALPFHIMLDKSYLRCLLSFLGTRRNVPVCRDPVPSLRHENHPPKPCTAHTIIVSETLCSLWSVWWWSHGRKAWGMHWMETEKTSENQKSHVIMTKHWVCGPWCYLRPRVNIPSSSSSCIESHGGKYSLLLTLWSVHGDHTELLLFTK